MSKKRIVILFGGKSVEHDISIRSATNVHQFIDKDLFEVFLIGIGSNGGWYQCKNPSQEIEMGDPLALNLSGNESLFLNLKTNESLNNIDAIFPVLHGTDGEDGSIQGLIKSVNLPCVGSGVLGSATSMDKLVTKKLLQEAGIPTAKYLQFGYWQRGTIDYDAIRQHLGLPFIIKPASLGSSVGVEKIKDQDQFERSVKESFKFDNQILFEQYVDGREFEIGIIGNEDPQSTTPGEVILDPQYDFYSFDAKYVDPNAAKIEIPAKLDESIVDLAKTLAEKTYTALNCNDYARVDFFVTSENQVLINEINTIPGFTNISMFPKLWEFEGLTYPNLITKLINLSLERQSKMDRITTNYESKLSN